MKKALLLSLVVVGSSVVLADEYDDDIYYNPNRQTEFNDSYDDGSVINGRDVDEYNRFGGYYETAVDTIGSGIASEQDFIYTTQIQKFYNPTIVVDNSETLSEVLENSYGNVDIILECGRPSFFTAYSFPLTGIYFDWNPWYWNYASNWAFYDVFYNPWTWWYSTPGFCYNFWHSYFHPGVPHYPGWSPGYPPHPHPGNAPGPGYASWNPHGNNTYRVNGGWNAASAPGANGHRMTSPMANGQRGNAVSGSGQYNGNNHRVGTVGNTRVSGNTTNQNYRVTGTTNSNHGVGGISNTNRTNTSVTRQTTSSRRSTGVTSGNSSTRNQSSFQNSGQNRSSFNQGNRSTGRSSGGSFGGGRSSGGGGHRGGGGGHRR